MEPLPECRFRGAETDPGHYECSSPNMRLLVLSNGVRGEFCRMCPHRNKELPIPKPEGGPGTELMNLLKSLGINPPPECDCREYAGVMDVWGVEGCRQRKDEIVAKLKDNQTKWKWHERLVMRAKAAANAVMTGIAFKINPLDPFPGLVDEAISRAETKAANPPVQLPIQSSPVPRRAATPPPVKKKEAVATKATKFILKNRQSPGDILVMSAAIETLHKLYPGKYRISVDTPVNSIYENNPGIVKPDADAVPLEMHYPLVNHSDQLQIHFMDAYCHYLGGQLGVPLPRAVDHPALYLSKEEQNQRYDWRNEKSLVLIVGGVKSDYTAKQYPWYQKVVESLKDKVQFAQVGEAHHLHTPLADAVNLIGKTTTRELIALAHQAQGAVGPSTFLQHICAALEKPYVCLLGGREPVAWVSYKTQKTLHTFGQLPCCLDKACWKSRVVKLPDGNVGKNSSLCEMPVETFPPSGKCMAMIEPETVAEAVLEFVGS